MAYYTKVLVHICTVIFFYNYKYNTAFDYFFIEWTLQRSDLHIFFSIYKNRLSNLKKNVLCQKQTEAPVFMTYDTTPLFLVLKVYCYTYMDLGLSTNPVQACMELLLKFFCIVGHDFEKSIFGKK